MIQGMKLFSHEGREVRGAFVPVAGDDAGNAGDDDGGDAGGDAGDDDGGRGRGRK